MNTKRFQEQKQTQQVIFCLKKKYPTRLAVLALFLNAGERQRYQNSVIEVSGHVNFNLIFCLGNFIFADQNQHSET